MTNGVEKTKCEDHGERIVRLEEGRRSAEDIQDEMSADIKIIKEALIGNGKMGLKTKVLILYLAFGILAIICLPVEILQWIKEAKAFLGI